MKLTTLWAFSEAILGGILHAVSIPFSGAVLTGFAVILISLMSLFSESRGEILKATLIVILVKGAVSPHSPLTAHFAVFLQGVLGELFFFYKKFYKISAMMLAVTTIILSSLQRIILLTIVYGNSLWESIDVYSNFILNKIFNPGINDKSLQVSFIIIIIYVSLHFLFGIYVGLIAGGLPGRISSSIKDFNINQLNVSYKASLTIQTGEKKRPWWKRKSRIYLFLILGFLIGLSYFHPELEDIYGLKLLIMVIRAVMILYIWFSFLSPVVYKSFRKFLEKKKSTYAEQVTHVINSFPHFKTIFELSWDNSSSEKYIKRIKKFITLLVILTLLPGEEFSSLKVNSRNV